MRFASGRPANGLRVADPLHCFQPVAQAVGTPDSASIRRLHRGLLPLALAALFVTLVAACQDKTPPDESAAIVVARRTLQELLADPNLRFEEEAAARAGDEFFVSGTVHGKGAEGAQAAAQYLARVHFLCDDALERRCHDIRYFQLRDRVLIPAPGPRLKRKST